MVLPFCSWYWQFRTETQKKKLASDEIITLVNWFGHVDLLARKGQATLRSGHKPVVFCFIIVVVLFCFLKNYNKTQKCYRVLDKCPCSRFPDTHRYSFPPSVHHGSTGSEDNGETGGASYDLGWLQHTYYSRNGECVHNQKCAVFSKTGKMGKPGMKR